MGSILTDRKGKGRDMVKKTERDMVKKAFGIPEKKVVRIPMKKLSFREDGNDCEFCGHEDYTVSPTLIRCNNCGVLHGRVNGVWIVAEDTIPTYEKEGKERKG